MPHGDDDKHALTNARGSESWQDWRGWWNESGSRDSKDEVMHI